MQVIIGEKLAKKAALKKKKGGGVNGRPEIAAPAKLACLRVDKPPVCLFQMKFNRYGCCRFPQCAEMKL